MSATVLYMSMSFDGFIAGPNEGPGNGLGDGGHRLPVLFGQGRRLFEGLGPEQIELERTRVLDGEGGVTHVHYRVGARENPNRSER